jgi:hypothetical protein
MPDNSAEDDQDRLSMPDLRLDQSLTEVKLAAASHHYCE